MTTATASSLLDRVAEAAEASKADLGFCVKDLVDGTVLDRAGDEIFPTASAIKIHILIGLLERAVRRELDLAERVVVRRDVAVAGSGVLSHLDEPADLALIDLANLMILVSDNTATNICIDRVGLPWLAEFLPSLGLHRTKVLRKMADTDAIAAGRDNVSTPIEMVETLAALFSGRPRPAVAAQCLAILTKPKVSPMRAAIPSAVPVADKTGRVTGVRVDAGIVYLTRRPFALAVMLKNAAGSEEQQDRVVRSVCRATYQAVARRGIA